MKKVICSKIFYCIIILIILIIIAYINIINLDNKLIITSEKNTTTINTNALTMMYEIEADSGEYQVSSDNSWPQDGYVFNEELSKCENGSKLIWNSETQKVLMQANSSDKCYVYFDKAPTPFENLQKVINQTEDGGTVTLAEDVYSDNKSLEINKSITLKGNGCSISVGNESAAAIKINTTNEVVLDGVKINVLNDVGYGIDAKANQLIIKDSIINAFKRGINFIPLNEGATLNISGSTIKNPKIANYDVETATIEDETRGISLGDVFESTITIQETNIFGYTIGINNTVSDFSKSETLQSSLQFISANINAVIPVNNWASNVVYEFANCNFKSLFALLNESTTKTVGIIVDQRTDGVKTGSLTINFYGGKYTVDNGASCMAFLLNVRECTIENINFYEFSDNYVEFSDTEYGKLELINYAGEYWEEWVNETNISGLENLEFMGETYSKHGANFLIINPEI